MSLTEIPSTVNKEARRERHKNLRFFSPLLANWRTIEANLSPQERRSERVFFWRIAGVATILFFLLSFLPQFFVTAQEFWSTSALEDVPLWTTESEVPLVDDGFLLKQEIISADRDITGSKEIREYTVEPGDTLSEIAAAHGVTVRTIMQNNSMSNADALRVGQVLKIIPVDGLIHEVAKNDTVESLAKKYKVEADKIIAQNGFTEGETLQVGDRIIIPGAKKDLPPPPAQVARGSSGFIPTGSITGSGRLIKPASGTYTQYFHYGHWGVDIANRNGGTIYAADGGTVIAASYGWNGGYGNMIKIDHGGNGMVTLYGHNKELYVNVGDSVSRGQPIAAMGHSGRVYGATGIHLHFEVQVDGVKRNPLLYF